MSLGRDFAFRAPRRLGSRGGQLARQAHAGWVFSATFLACRRRQVVPRARDPERQGARGRAWGVETWQGLSLRPGILRTISVRMKTSPRILRRHWQRVIPLLSAAQWCRATWRCCCWMGAPEVAIRPRARLQPRRLDSNLDSSRTKQARAAGANGWAKMNRTPALRPGNG